MAIKIPVAAPAIIIRSQRLQPFVSEKTETTFRQIPAIIAIERNAPMFRVLLNSGLIVSVLKTLSGCCLPSKQRH